MYQARVIPPDTPPVLLYSPVRGPVLTNQLSLLNNAPFEVSVADAIEGHDDSLTKAGVLHRDISVGNTLIVREEGGHVKGLLVDWDQCSLVEDVNTGPRRPDRAGTWQFTSCHLLQKHATTHTVVDDRESALHLLTWLVLRHGEHNLSPEATADSLRTFDVVYWDHKGQPWGGSDKQLNLRSRRQIPLHLEFKQVPHVKSLLNDLAAVFAFRYRQPTKKDDDALKAFQLRYKNNPAMLAEFEHVHVSKTYATNMALLAESGWLVKPLRDHIANHTWLLDDGAPPFRGHIDIGKSGVKSPADCSGVRRQSSAKLGRVADRNRGWPAKAAG
ncbi:hypothetical protein FIBSPDRAFT_943337 [Athelia psychrophila]|uniref:Fungal-type protein kinase domain-containing protein n=1 Tax=Athelia psychrophila TaxID=1759441 RepID=A0A166WA26_9AGAM|nr:hypothetical protein FIBSPDRAFT_943337 [Fibularhizoctonia sp. CBS 109695]